MIIVKNIIPVVSIIIVLILTSCTQIMDELAPEKNHGKYPVNSINETDVKDLSNFETQVSLDSWLGYYAHYGSLPNVEDSYTGYNSINFTIFKENENYFGYINIDGANNDYVDFYDRILVEIKGTEDLIQVHFLESYIDEESKREMFSTYEKDEILFSLKKEDIVLKTIWENMILNEKEEDLERGFVQVEALSSVILNNMDDRAIFLRSFGIKTC